MRASSLSHLFSTPAKTPTKLQQDKPRINNKPDPIISLLQLCKNHRELLQVHAFLVKTSLVNVTHAFGPLLLSFASFNDPSSFHYSRKLFDTSIVPRNSFIYNTMIRGYFNNGRPREAFLVYTKMVGEEGGLVLPDEFTFTFVFSASSKIGCGFEGKQAHAQMVKCGLKFGTFTWNSLMDFYVKIGEMGSVIRRVFCGIENPDVVSWNCLIDGYVKSGDLGGARKVFDEMPERDVVSWTILLVGYANAGLMHVASDLFDSMPERNLVSWSALIDGYVKVGCYGKAFDLFKEMQVAGVEADAFLVTTLLSACAKSGALDQGQWLHAYVNKDGIKVDAHLSTALIDMYSKCGDIDMARKGFQETRDKKVFVWNAMVGALAMHSYGEEAAELFAKMIESGVEPNAITYINVLSACTHSGFVDVGLRIFGRLAEDEKLKPTIEHYGCLVDLLGRAGLLHEAFRVVQTMPMAADGTVWRSLLGACKLHGHVELGGQVGRILIQLEPLNDMNYVLLSNVYAMSNRWDEVGKLRREMKVRGLTKSRGCSSVEVNGEVREFVSRDHSHPQSREIYDLLHVLIEHLMQGSDEELYCDGCCI